MTMKRVAPRIHFHKNLFFSLSSLLFLFCFLPAADAADPSYRVVRTISAGGEGGWDYLTVDARGPAGLRLEGHARSRPERRLGRGGRRDPEHGRRARHRPRPGSRPRLHEQRPREHGHDLRPEDAGHARNRQGSRGESRMRFSMTRSRIASSPSTAAPRTSRRSTRRRAPSPARSRSAGSPSSRSPTSRGASTSTSRTRTRSSPSIRAR